MSSPTVVLVHGGFVDGSGWKRIYDELRSGDLDVRVVQNATRTLAEDATVTRNLLDSIDGSVVLVGHSYGGAVITEAGTHGAVAALVYLTAFAPAQGESVGSIIETFPKDGPQPPILPPSNGYLFLDREKFAASFAADVDPDEAAFMADSQVPWGLEAVGGTITDPAWRSKPSWYLHVTDDRMIPPAQQLAMAERMGSTVVDPPGSHAIYVSQPKVVAGVIRSAVAGVAG